MDISIFELYSVGIGPSSSHTVGPMRAAKSFAEKAELPRVHQVVVNLYGSLALTGAGHGTDTAVFLGLSGCAPETVDPVKGEDIIAAIKRDGCLYLNGTYQISFNADEDLVFNKHITLDEHANGVTFSAYDQNGELVTEQTCFSIGGGFVLTREQIQNDEGLMEMSSRMPYPFDTAEQLFEYCRTNNMSIAQIMMENEKVNLPEAEIREKILHIWEVMDESINNGFASEYSQLPGGLKVRRRANRLYEKLKASNIPASDLNWLNAYAIAVNEENAAGGRVVTAPTNGAAGIVPAVLKYHLEVTGAGEDDIIAYMLTTAAIGILYKKGASISAAEVGCQGEVGVASSMAAAGLCAVWGGTLAQIEMSAEMGMEHNLGLTCDPVGGLVQIPCIERNAMGSSQVVNSVRLALMEDGQHMVPLDNVIRTMKETGRDMSTRYKETSLGGLAVNMPAC